MYAMLTQDGKVVSSIHQMKIAALFMTSISSITVTRVQDLRAIAVKQGQVPNAPVYCESTAEALAEGILVEEGWIGYVGVKDQDVTIQVNHDMTTAYFGSTLVWYSMGGMSLGAHTTKNRIFEIVKMKQQDILPLLLKLYHGH